MNRNFQSLSALAAHLEGVAARIPPAEHVALEEIGQRVQTVARGKIGNEQAGWAPIAASTLADKERHGYPVPSPLLRTGALKESISHEVKGNEVAIGSPEMDALWQELGTSRGIPPRSFLGSSMIDTKEANLGSLVFAMIRAFR